MISDELGQGNSLSLWETISWAFSNSDNSGGSDDKKGKKPLISSSKSPTPTTITPKPTATPLTPAGGPKRDRNGMAKNMKGAGGGGGEGEGESDHDVNLWTEKERRKRMGNMFTNLHAFLPQLPPKADKSTVVDEAITYIKKLEKVLQKLQKQKLERLQGERTIDFEPTLVAPNMLTYNSLSREAYLADQISSMNLGMTAYSSNSLPIVPSFIRFETWSSPNVTLTVFGMDAHISVCVPKKLVCFFTTIAYVLEKQMIEVVTAQLSSDNFRNMYMIHANASVVSVQHILPVEEIFKLAVGDIIFWMSN